MCITSYVACDVCIRVVKILMFSGMARKFVYIFDKICKQNWYDFFFILEHSNMNFFEQCFCHLHISFISDKGSFNNYVDQGYLMWAPPPPSIWQTWRFYILSNLWTFYWPPPLSSCPRSYWMSPKGQNKGDIMPNLIAMYSSFSSFKAKRLTNFECR